MSRLIQWRRAFAVLSFSLILAGAFEVHYLTILFADRFSLADRVGQLRYGKLPEIRPFLEEVERRTDRGTEIALVTPARTWNQGYEYAFYRAAYVLAGRTVLPVMTPDDRPIIGNLERADLVAAWGVELDPERFSVIWRGAGGTLARFAK